MNGEEIEITGQLTLFGESMVNLGDMDSLDKVLFLNLLAHDIHENAKSKGFYDDVVSFPQSIALIHSELSEALEAHRNGETVERIAEELADAVIRILDTGAYQHYNVGSALIAKMEKNKARPHKHGKRY